MKPSPNHDFPVGVTTESSNHDANVERMYRGIYTISLNHLVSVNVIPKIERHEPWPPEPADDIDAVSSVDEARRTILVFAQLALTPDDERAGTTEVLFRGEDKTFVLYLSKSQFEELSAELSSLHAQLPGTHRAIPVAEIRDTTLGSLLLNRVVPSGALSPYQLGMLGR